MKLRISGNSIRLRLLRSEVDTFIETGHLEQTVHFAPGKDAFLTYGLKHDPVLESIEIQHKSSEVIVVLPTQQATAWAGTEQVGIYSAVDLGDNGSLDIIVEKDFACLDLSDAENQDTFPNPQLGTAC
jgi:hypothetical protein